MRGESDRNDGVREWRREETAVRRTNRWGEKEGAKRKQNGEGGQCRCEGKGE